MNLLYSILIIKIQILQFYLIIKKKTKTRLFATNSLCFLKHCDKIVAIKKGKIIEMGTYQELIENNGFFTKFVHENLKKNTENNASNGIF